MMSLFICFLFFFQAEDGIRDGHVTGVQTCTLPIWELDLAGVIAVNTTIRHDHGAGGLSGPPVRDRGLAVVRSEERRVGKECRGRRGPEELKKGKERREDEAEKEEARWCGGRGRYTE